MSHKTECGNDHEKINQNYDNQDLDYVQTTVSSLFTFVVCNEYIEND